ncbi:44802_t:CDS:2, partial [Gigaspora margarita]
MSKIKIRALKKNSLISESYQNHLRHFLNLPLSLKIDKTSQFSKQSSEVHDLLKSIKDTNEYSDDFFLAAQKFINKLYNESKQPHKQILTKDYWSSSTETLIDDHLNSNHLSTSKTCPELSISRCLNYSEILETHRTTNSLDSSLESNHFQLRQNLNNQNLVILNEDQNLTLSENFQASTSDHDLINADLVSSEQSISALSKVPPENIPTQLQQQSININVNTEDNEDNQNWKKLLKKNWHFLAIITALT